MYLPINKRNKFCYLIVTEYCPEGNKIVLVIIKLPFCYLLVTIFNYNNINKLIVQLGIKLPSFGVSGLCCLSDEL